MQHKLLKNSPPSYGLAFACGLLAGVLTRLTDFCPPDSLWGFSSIATLLGFWILSVTLIVLISDRPLSAGVGSFLYLFGMTSAFYALEISPGGFPLRLDPAFRTSLFLLYSALSLCAGAGAFLLRFWERGTKPAAILCALPVGALLAEAAGTGVYVFTRSLFLFQFLMDLVGALVLGAYFYRRVSSRAAYGAAVLLAGAAVFLAVYLPSLPRG